MAQTPQLERLEAVIDRLEADQPVDAAELREIAAELETGKKYRCSTCQMYCTGEDVMVIFNTETEEFIQIEIPMDEDEEVQIIRAT